MNEPAQTTSTPILEMSGVNVGSLKYPDVTTLENVNWRVMPGDYWVIAGMHASGKTDLISMAGGLMPPLTGTYKFFGRKMPIFDEAELPERLRMGLVFATGHLFHRLTVAENIMLPLQYHQNPNPLVIAEHLRSVLELTELTPFANHAPGQLGVHWQKRAVLARALILQPEVLLLDNPLGGMDFRHSYWWLTFLGKLSEGHSFFGGRKLTLALTAEDLRPWRNRATHFAVLQQKTMTVLGQRAVLVGHAEPLVKELLAEEFTDV